MARRKPEDAAKHENGAARTAHAVGPQPPMLYADGFGNVLMSPINTRVTVIVATGAEGTPRAVLELVVPTPALLGFIGQLQQHVRDQGPGLLQGFEELKKQMAQHVGIDKAQP